MINSYSLSYFLVSGLAKKTRNFQIQSFRVYWDVNIANSKFIHLFKKVLYTCCTQDTSLAFYLNVDLLTRRRQWHPTPVLLLENPMDGGAWWAADHGVTKSEITEWLHFHFLLLCIGEENGNPRQCSCLENPRGGGAWWAAVYGVAELDATEAT